MNHHNETIAIYPYGSRVYGTDRPNSDWDYVQVEADATNEEMTHGNLNIKKISPAHFQEMLSNHHITALECYFLPEDKVKKLPETSWGFKLDLFKLRSSISEKASHSWVKAKKKLESPYDWAIDERERGKKSLFHSFRILNFGIQIARDGKISDYSGANNFYHEIISMDSVYWEDYQTAFKQRHNELSTEFKKLAPK